MIRFSKFSTQKLFFHWPLYINRGLPLKQLSQGGTDFSLAVHLHISLLDSTKNLKGEFIYEKEKFALRNRFGASLKLIW